MSKLESVATEVLGAGYHCVVDATFLKRADRRRFAELAKQLGVPFRILHTRAPTKVLYRRVGARKGDASEATTEVLTMSGWLLPSFILVQLKSKDMFAARYWKGLKQTPPK